MFEDSSLLCTGQEEPGGEVPFTLRKEQPAQVESQRPFTVRHGARPCRVPSSVFLVGWLPGAPAGSGGISGKHSADCCPVEGFGGSLAGVSYTDGT